jgi:hypothetical protein
VKNGGKIGELFPSGENRLSYPIRFPQSIGEITFIFSNLNFLRFNLEEEVSTRVFHFFHRLIRVTVFDINRMNLLSTWGKLG